MKPGSTPVPVRNIAIDRIRPGRQQARRTFDPGALHELASSIRESGVVQPVVLRTLPGGSFELLAGERRWRAAQQAGLHEIPSLVRDDLSDQDAFVFGLIENLQREELPPVDAAAGMQRLGEEFDLTHEQIGQRIGKSREYVSNHLRLLKLDPAVAQMVNDGQLSVGHGKVLAGLDRGQQVTLAALASKNRLTVRRLEMTISAQRRSPDVRKNMKSSDWIRLESDLSDYFGTAVTIRADRSNKKGGITLSFNSLDELDGLLERSGFSRRFD